MLLRNDQTGPCKGLLWWVSRQNLSGGFRAKYQYRAEDRNDGWLL
jgi:hypothetical protein